MPWWALVCPGGPKWVLVRPGGPWVLGVRWCALVSLGGSWWALVGLGGLWCALGVSLGYHEGTLKLPCGYTGGSRPPSGVPQARGTSRM